MGFQTSNGILLGQGGMVGGVSYVGLGPDFTTQPSLLATITNPAVENYDLFGFLSSIGSNRIVVSAYNYTGGTIYSKGRVYVYDLNGNLLNTISNPNGNVNEYFGISVAVGSGRIVIGANYNGNYGRVYIYDLNANLLKTIDGTNLSYLGYSGVAVGCGRIVAAAAAYGASGSPLGAIYIYGLNGNLIKTITDPGNLGSTFNNGYSLAVADNRIVVGVRTTSSSAGTVFIYDLNGSLLYTITDPAATSSDNFGYSVSVGSGRIVIGTSTQTYYIYDLNANLLKTLTGLGFVSGAVSVGSGRIVISSQGALIVKVYDLNGNQIGSTLTPGASDSHIAAAAAGYGRMVLSNPGYSTSSGRIFIYSIPTMYDGLSLF